MFAQTPDICLFLQQTLPDTQNTRCAGKIATVFEQTAAFIERILENGKRDGAFLASLDSKTTAGAIIGALSGASHKCIASRRMTLGTAINEVRAMAFARVTR